MTTRRAFLARSAAAGMLLSAPSIARAQTDRDTLDIAIVGGGVAGLYAAMRLGEETRASIGVFESTDRLGGRLVSVQFPDIPSQTAEIGGMRLRHTDEIALKIAKDLLGPDALQTFGYPTTGFYLRDRALPASPKVGDIPYYLDAQEKKIIAGGDDLLVRTINDIQAAAQGHMEDKGIWQLLLQTRSKDGVNYIRDTLGYQSVVSNWNAKAALPWFEADFAPDTRYFKVKGGIERIPHAAAAAFQSGGGGIRTEHRLMRLDQLDDGRIGLSFQTAEGVRHVSAEKVILALPPHALQSLSADTFLLRESTFAAAMEAVDKVPLAKIHMSFAQDWWTPKGMGLGALISDNPIQKTYRWGVDPTSGHALLMASYHDGAFMEFWDALSEGERYGNPDWIASATGPNGQPVAGSLQKILPASEGLVQEAWRQVRRTHGLDDSVAPPLAATYQNWSREPWGAAVHFWAIGADPGAVKAYLREPVPGVHVCNEAWSDAQGWVHGATEAAEALLTQNFDLPPYVSG